MRAVIGVEDRFAKLDRAHVDARYSPAYEVGGEDLVRLAERVQHLQKVIARICQEKFAGREHRILWLRHGLRRKVFAASPPPHPAAATFSPLGRRDLPNRLVHSQRCKKQQNLV